jgi:hypothetical protein
MANWNVNTIEVLNIADDPNPEGWAVTLHWDCTDTQGEGDDAVSGRTYGSITMPAMEDGGKFTDLRAMEKEARAAKAVDWVKEQLGEEGVAAEEAKVAAQIEAQRNPRTITL